MASAKNAPTFHAAWPGSVTSSTPTNPSAGAVQRWTPTFSFSTTTERSVVKSGAEKLIATAPASGMSLKAMKIAVIEQSCDSARLTWSNGRAVRNTASPRRGSTIRKHGMSANTERKNATSPTG